MIDSEINAYLEKEIINNGNIVTYRQLSRKLSLHVNAAKNALASFYSLKRENKEPIYATFWLSGEVLAQTANASGDEMDVDGEDSRDCLIRKVVIVGEEDLENVKATFSKVHVHHVYSLSIAPLMSASQLCDPSREVHEVDKAADDDFARRVGKVVSQQVKRGEPVRKPIKASVSKQSSVPFISKPGPKQPEPKQTPQQKLKPSGSFTSEKSKPKASGVLSWAKPKPKDIDKGKELSAAKSSVKKGIAKEPMFNGNQKRGAKRKSDVMSQQEGEEESEEKPAPTPEIKATVSRKAVAENTSASARVKNGVVLSDDEDEVKPAKARSSVKGKLKDIDESDTERSVRAIMDIDDSYVVKASKLPPRVTPEEDEEEPPLTDHVDSAMDEDSDDPAPKAKPRKRKQKKNMPMGRNGLPKRRVVKSKTEFDEKGYMVTMDYSSYESVDEEEVTQEPQKARPKFKSTAAKKSSTQQKGDVSASESEASAQVQSRGITNVEAKKTERKKSSGRPSLGKERQTNGSQKSLASFFGPRGGKSKK